MTTPIEFSCRGPFEVGVRTVALPDPRTAGRTLPTDLWYPAAPEGGGEAADHPFGQPHEARVAAPPLDRTQPLVVFSHGNAGLRRQSTFLTTHLASWGIAVVAPDHTGNTFPEMARVRDEAHRIELHRAAREQRPADALTAIDAALSGELGPIALDPTRIAALGHSFGGWTATKLPALDPRIRAVCALAPASEPFVGRRAYQPGELPFASPIPTLVIVGVDDVLVDLETSVRPLIERLGTSAWLVGLQEADHFHFCDGIELLHRQHVRNPRPDQPRETKPYAACLPEARTHRAIRALVTGFFTTVFAAPGAADSPTPLQLDPQTLAALDPAVVAL